MGQPWFKKGLRFECNNCGNCCSGASGIVEFDESEGRGMAACLELEYEEFLARYGQLSDGVWHLKEVRPPAGEEGWDCSLLIREEGTGRMLCRVHPERPTQCRTWPFWSANLKSRRTWKRTAYDCEGIGQGPIVPCHEIQRQCRLTDDLADVRPR